MKDEFNYARMVESIANVRTDTTETDVFNGRNWYPTGQTLAQHVGALAGFKSADARLQGAGIIAALSPMTSWGLNVLNAIRCASGLHYGSLPLSVERAEAIKSGRRFAEVLTPGTKTMNFAHNLSGNLQVVTLDRWALRVAGVKASTARGKNYELCSDAYRTVADAFDEQPATTQAITWCALRGSAE